MDDLDFVAEKLNALNTGSVSVFDVVMQMNDANPIESGLDVRTWVLVRLGALAAMDAPTSSYVALLAMCEDTAITLTDLSGAVVAAGPVVGSPRLLAAALNLADAVIAKGP